MWNPLAALLQNNALAPYAPAAPAAPQTPQTFPPVPLAPGVKSHVGGMGDPNAFRTALQAWQAQRPMMIGANGANGALAMPDFQQQFADWRLAQPNRRDF
jgi:hypothetical protein